MTLTNDDLKAIGQVVDQKLDTRLRPLETTVGQMKTALNAVLAGQDAQATKADIHDLKVEVMGEVKSLKRRVENLEEETETPNPYKH